jgi:hypothetical protein
LGYGGFLAHRNPKKNEDEPEILRPAHACATTAETTMAALSWNGLNGITPTARGLLLNPNRGIGFVVQTTHAKEFALAHWLVGGADGGRLCLRCFDGAGIGRENIAGDALASGTTLQWAPTSKTWQAGAVMQESVLNRRQTVRFGPEVAFAQISIIGFDGQIEVEALRLYGLPEDAPAILYGCPALPVGGRTLMFSASWDLPSMPPGATSDARAAFHSSGRAAETCDRCARQQR